MGQTTIRAAFLTACLLLASPGASADDQPERKLLWGDTHLHTNNSFDAFLNRNHTVSPDMAYRYARGEPIIHAYHRARVQIQTPLDFLVVTDHAEFLGGIRDIYSEGIQDDEAGIIRSLMYWYYERQIRGAIDGDQAVEFFANVLPLAQAPREAAAEWVANAEGSAIPGAAISAVRAWKELAEAAEKNNEPGRFTAFMGWEWTSTPGGANMHRIVMTNANAAESASFTPYSSTDSPYPEDLWNWIEETSEETGLRFLAIPHNPNVSKGMMFDLKTFRGEPIDAEYAARRARFEPIVEMTQIKGDSETHPKFSPDDEFADYEPYPFYLQRDFQVYEPVRGEYVRGALRDGLDFQATIGVNPFQMGMIGATDSHTGLSSAEEPNFWGKFSFDSVPENKPGSALQSATGWTMSAAGLAAVWATENTRDAILDALQRREVYATTGPRIEVRVFGGWTLDGSHMLDLPESGYEHGVPMGSVLPAGDGEAPGFIVTAMRDPLTAGLDRLQMIKGWRDSDGKTHEKVYDIAWSGDREIGTDGKLPAIADNVDRSTGELTDDPGEPMLATYWQDPDFDPAEQAFYYVRVLQAPTARHSLLDRLALGLDNAFDYPDVIQERAYTSPIWYIPE